MKNPKTLIKNDKNPFFDELESQEFYELMQTYRHTIINNQLAVYEAFENVKNFIRNNFIPSEMVI